MKPLTRKLNKKETQNLPKQSSIPLSFLQRIYPLNSLTKQFLGGSLILLITFNLFNLINFFFQFSMARLLSVEHYGILATLFSMLYVIVVFAESIQVVTTKYSAEQENKGKLKNLFKRTFKKAIKFSIVIFAAYLVIMYPLAPLLKIPYSLLAMNGLLIITSFLIPTTRGILQGKKRFTALGINLVIEGLVKLSLAIALVMLGWSVYGALGATIISIFIALALSLIPLRDILKAKEENIVLDDIYSYTKPVFIVMLAILLFYNLDMFIAKIMFTPEIAGNYAIASMLAKMVFLATQPISKALFPMTAEKKSKKDSEKLLKQALTFLSLCLVVALLAFYFFPALIVQIFSGKTLPSASGILFILGLAMAIASIANLLLFYNLSKGKTKNAHHLFVFILIEAILLYFFSNNVFQFALALLASATIFLWGVIHFFRE